MILDRYLILPRKKSGAAPRSISVMKSISWRVVGTIDTVIISWAITGTWQWALSIGGIEVVSKMILYYFHERVWENYTKTSR